MSLAWLNWPWDEVLLIRRQAACTPAGGAPLAWMVTLDRVSRVVFYGSGRVQRLLRARGHGGTLEPEVGHWRSARLRGGAPGVETVGRYGSARHDRTTTAASDADDDGPKFH